MCTNALCHQVTEILVSASGPTPPSALTLAFADCYSLCLPPLFVLSLLPEMSHPLCLCLWCCPLLNLSPLCESTVEWTESHTLLSASDSSMG